MGYPPRLAPICSDTEPDTDTDSVMLDLRALPVSMLLTCPCPVLPDTSTTERGRLRLSPTSDTDSDTPDTDTLELDSRALPVSTLPMFPCLAMDLDTDTTTERGKPRLSISTDTLVLDTPVSDTDTESTPAMSVCAPTIWELPFLAKKLRYLQENSKIWDFYRKNYEIKF